MGLFDSKEEKNQKKIEKLKQQYHLDNLSEKDMEIVQEILGKTTKVASTVGMMTMNSQEQAKLLQNDTLIAQNWLIIRKLEEINQKLDK